MKNYTDGINKRAIGSFCLFCLLMLALVGRLCSIVLSDGLQQTAQTQSSYTLTVADERGLIYDCHMEPLVGTQEKWLTAVFPTPRNQQKVLDAVSPDRRSTVAELLEKGTPFVLETDAAVDAEMVYSFSVAERYSEDQLAAHIIGYLDYSGTGVTGIEKSFEEFLSAHGRKLQVTGTLNALQQTIAGLEPEVRISEDAGAGVVLTIDAEIQRIIEEIGGEMLDKGAIVVMDPYTGQIKAAASFPGYSPLDLETAVNDTEGSPMLNRAFLPYSVGSTFKIVTAAAALETLGSEACLGRTFSCTGILDVYGQSFRCHKREGHGELDIFDALRESCNPWFISLGLEVGGKAMLDMTKRMGFGEDIPLADGITVRGGSVPTADDLTAPAAVANLSFGQGSLSASPVQIARMVSAVVNGGRLVVPSLVIGTTEDGKTVERSPGPLEQTVFSRDTAAQLQLLLNYAVMSDDSQNAKPTLTTAGGKTATAQTGRFDADGNELEQGWFAGYFPARNPEYVVVILAENEGLGNKTAAPVFAAVADAVTALKETAADKE